MKTHRISAGALVADEASRLLLVRHRKPGVYDFWAAPGGGVIDDEELAATAQREVREETGLDVVPGTLVYVEEFFSPQTRFCKFWFAATTAGGALSTASVEAAEEHIVEAGWFTREQVQGIEHLFPELLRERYWRERAEGFRAGLQYVGLRRMAFW